MSEIVKALVAALASIMRPRMLLLLLWPLAVALVLWLALAYLFWTQAAAWIELQFAQSTLIAWAITLWPLVHLAGHLASILLGLLFVPLVLATAVLIIGIFAMPQMVEEVAQRAYPQLARRQGGSFVGSAWNGLAALAWLALFALLSLPLWLFPPLWPLLSVLLVAYLNQRVYRYDALAEHASVEEMRTLLARHRGGYFLLGLATALAGLVPFFGFFVPVYAGLAFVHYCLARLDALRDEPVSVQ